MRKCLVAILVFVLAVGLFGCKKKETDNSKDTKENTVAEDKKEKETTEEKPTEEIPTEEITPEVIPEEDEPEEFSLSNLPNKITWHGCEFTIESLEKISASGWRFNGAMISFKEYKTLAGDGYCIVKLDCAANPVSLSEITEESIKEIKLKDTTGKEYPMIGYSYPDIGYSDKDGFYSMPTQPMIILGFDIDEASVDNMMIVVGEDTAVPAK